MEKKVSIELSSADLMLLRYALEFKRNSVNSEIRSQLDKRCPDYDYMQDLLDDACALVDLLSKLPKNE